MGMVPHRIGRLRGGPMATPSDPMPRMNRSTHGNRPKAGIAGEALVVDVIRRIEPGFDIIQLVTAFLTGGVALVLIYRHERLTMAAIDILAMVSCILLFLFRRRIPIGTRVFVTLMLLLLFGANSLLTSGFMGNGLMALAMGVLLAVSFLRRSFAILHAVLSLLPLVLMTAAVSLGRFMLPATLTARLNSPFDWLLQTISLTLFAFIAFFSIRFIRNALVETIGHLHDKVDELEKTREDVDHLAYYDALTGLPNRYRFAQDVDAQIQQGLAKASLLLFDIRDFRSVNMHLGADHGDRILKRFGETLLSRANESFLPARIGGNEFALWLHETDEHVINDDLAASLTKLRLALAQDGLFNDFRFYVPKSRYPEDGGSFDACYRSASMALKSAKQEQRNGLYPYKPAMAESFKREAHIKVLLEPAIRQRQFQIVFQLKQDVERMRPLGMEALCRWHTPTLGSIPPSEFLPIIAHTHLAEEFHEMILLQTLDEFARIMPALPTTQRLSINLSPLFFLHPGFRRLLMQALEERSIPADRIMLEITEEVMVSDLAKLRDRVEALRSSGIGISLDDFGSGYASLQYLTDVTFDEIKIDRAFIRKIDENDQAYALLQAIISIGRLLGCQVVAEGVETQAQARRVQAAGCFVMQGYLYARPVPADEVIALMRG